ncbi:MAG: phosphoserine phosphatase related protein [uncultured bacterium]|nr:MAG: phosphoserine phosphatase related protein [uncultured bacterium]
MKPTTRKKIAIFDIDGTIYRSSLLFRTFDILIARKMFKRKVYWQALKIRNSYFNRKTDYLKYASKLVELIKENICGISQKEVLKVSRELVRSQKSIYFKYTRNLIRHLRQEYILIGVSGSLTENLTELNKYLKFDYVFGTQFEVGGNGHYTGTILSEPAKDKEIFIKEFIDNNQLLLKDSIAVGDTMNDYCVLKMVENPIVFNPDSELYHCAKKNNWKIIVERKNVVYEINKI